VRAACIQAAEDAVLLIKIKQLLLRSQPLLPVLAFQYPPFRAQFTFFASD